MKYLSSIKEKLNTNKLLLIESIISVYCFVILVWMLYTHNWLWLYFYVLLFYNIYQLDKWNKYCNEEKYHA